MVMVRKHIYFWLMYNTTYITSCPVILLFYCGSDKQVVTGGCWVKSKRLAYPPHPRDYFGH